MNEAPTREEQTEFSIRAFRGVEVGLGPDNSPFVIPRETAVPDLIFYPAGSLGEAVESEGGEA